MNRIPEEHERRAYELFADGLSVRAIAKQLGHTHSTIHRYLRGKVAPESGGKRVAAACDWCGSVITADRESDRRTSRSKHTFCDRYCYGAWRAKQRDSDRCGLCNRRRRECTGITFSNGFCQQCYASLIEFGGNREFALSRTVSKILKRDMRYAGRRKVHQSRPATASRGDDSGGA